MKAALMNRTDRLLAIVLELQARGRIRAEDLAAVFETSKRTIYRDVQALCESGVPVVAVPGQGYSLVEGFFLPPVSFTRDEATMLLLGANFMAQSFDAQYRAAAESAARKIEAVLGRRLRDEVHYLQKSIMFIAPGQGDAETLRRLRQAILEHRTARFIYYTRYPDAASKPPAPRLADPYGLLHYAGAWYLLAYCHMRKSVRNFRLDRIDALEVLAGGFTRPADFDFNDSSPDRGSRNLVIRALFDPSAARWVRESRYFFVTAEEDRPDGLLVTLRVRQESEALQWLLSWGGHVRVLEPASLRRQIAAEAGRLLAQHRDEGT
jgi:predicted DNA-binding transcriptional regulator YafY